MKGHVSIFAAIALVASVALGDEANFGLLTRDAGEMPPFESCRMKSPGKIERQTVFTTAPQKARQLKAAATLAAARSLTGAAASSVTLDLPTNLPVSDYGRIKELARSLDYDWDKCYRFVRDNIKFTPYGGILRGPERTLLDMEGSDGDQAFLLLALLRASGYESTVVFIPLTDSSAYLVPMYSYNGKYAYNMCSWLDIPEEGTINDVYQKAYKKLRTAGVGAAYLQSDDGTYYLATEHFWVVCNVTSDKRYYLDPSLKPTASSAPRKVLQDMGYNRSTLISAAGGTLGTSYVRNLSSANLGKQLDKYCANLRKAWTNDNAAASEFIGTSVIVKQTDDSYWNAATTGNVYDFLSQSDATKNAYRALATVTHGTISKQFFLDEVGARHLWISYASASTTYPKGVFKIDDTTLATETTGSSSEALTMNIKVAYTPGATDCPYDIKRNLAYVYTIPLGFDGDYKGGMRKWAADELAKARAKSSKENDPAVTARVMQLAGQQWASQLAMLQRVRNRIQDSEYRLFYEFGISGYDGGPYVDLKNSFSHRTTDGAKMDGYTFFYSAMEHAALEQLNGTNSPAVSTIKVLDLASKAGQYIYFMTSNNYSSVKSSLTGYSDSLKSSFETAAKAGRRLLLPKSGSVTLNQWTGYGYIEQGIIGNNQYTTHYAISGKRNGGTASYSLSSIGMSVDTFINKSLDRVGNLTLLNYSSVMSDPIAMPSGAFTDEVADLSLNSATPLSWIRSYDSRNSSSKTSLGYGWSHTFDASAGETYNADAVFGNGAVAAVIPTVVAIAVVDDMLADQDTCVEKENARRWLIAALTTQWWTTRHTDSAVSIDLGTRVLMFQRLDDGTYAPEPGQTASLRLNNGIYELEERLGSKYVFNKDNRLSTITDRSGNVTRLTYSGGKLTTIENDYGGKLTVTYSGDLISSVKDNLGRSVSYTYSGNCMTKVTDPESKVWTMTYDSTTHAMLTEKDPDSNVTVQNTYNAFQQVIKQISAIGKTWNFGYISNLQVWEEDPEGRRMSETYDSEGRRLQRIERDGTTTQTAYNGHGNVSVMKNPLGRLDYFGYDGRDNLIWKAEASGARQENYTYDSNDRLVEVKNALNQVTRFTYDSCDRKLTTTMPDGSKNVNVWTSKGLLSSKSLYSSSGKEIRTTTYTYGALGLPIRTKVTGVGLPAAGIVESVTYDDAGQHLTKTDANGNTTSFAYDKRGLVTKRTNPLSKVTTYTYNGAGRMTKVTNARSKSTTTAYTASGNIASTTYADGGKVTNEYDASDNLKKTIDERGAAVSCTRDALGRVLMVSDKVGKDSYVYNAAGLLLRSTNAVGVVTTVNYDSLYRPVLSNDGRGGAWWTEYDLLDRPVAKKNPIGKIDRTTYDVMGRTAATTRPSGAVDRFGYDEFGNMSSYTNSEGKVYTMQYDALGRMVSATNGEGEKVFTAEYDGVGNLLSRTDRKGNRRTFEYDKVNRLVKRSFGGKTEAFVYDDVGNMTSASNVNSLTTFTYDSCNRMTYSYLTIYPASGVTSSKRYFTSYYKRDLGGLVTNVTYGSTSKAVSRTYDESGNLISVKDWLGHTWTFQYDAAGKMTRRTSPDGVNSTFTYDAAERLIGWKVGNIAGRGIELDAAGRRLQDTITAGAMPKARNTRRAQNVYDNADRIISATVSNGTSAPTQEKYEYDENGALVNVTSDGTSAFSAVYTKNGFVESVCGNAFVYDALDNRLAASGELWIPDYTDALSRPLVEYSTSWTVVRYYIWGPNCLLGYIDSNGTLTVVHSDEMGNVIALTTTSGTILHTANYGPNGENWGMTGSNPTSYAWLGGYGVQRIDCGVGMGTVYSTRHRLYSINLHRFLSSDPMGLDGGLNLYQYGGGNPIALIDPSGLCSSPARQGYTYSASENLIMGMESGQYSQYVNNSIAMSQSQTFSSAAYQSPVPSWVGDKATEAVKETAQEVRKVATDSMLRDNAFITEAHANEYAKGINNPYYRRMIQQSRNKWRGVGGIASNVGRAAGFVDAATFGADVVAADSRDERFYLLARKGTSEGMGYLAGGLTVEATPVVAVGVKMGVTAGTEYVFDSIYFQERYKKNFVCPTWMGKEKYAGRRERFFK